MKIKTYIQDQDIQDITDHIQDLCNKAKRKLRALAREIPYMNLQKKKGFNECLFKGAIQLLTVDLDAS